MALWKFAVAGVFIVSYVLFLLAVVIVAEVQGKPEGVLARCFTYCYNFFRKQKAYRRVVRIGRVIYSGR